MENEKINKEIEYFHGKLKETMGKYLPKKYLEINNNMDSNRYVIGIDPFDENTKNIKPITIMKVGEDDFRIVNVDTNVGELTKIVMDEYNSIVISDKIPKNIK